MSVIFVLLGLGVCMAAGAIVCYVWAVQDGQMDDLQGPAERLIAEDHLATLGKQSADLPQVSKHLFSSGAAIASPDVVTFDRR